MCVLMTKGIKYCLEFRFKSKVRYKARVGDTVILNLKVNHEIFTARVNNNNNNNLFAWILQDMLELVMSN